ncbi:MAG: ribonuclease HII [Candidatus ainarchaeum sp.]|nr:ribonuclease HII [Candidatus ainarchaeum sp.]MDD5096018.1 ribonuclease HII [Candidatus ainarchaeum sp.]
MGNLIAGVDEAGRGSVLGPLVISCASSGRDSQRLLKKYASKDSKQLTARQREEILVELEKFCTFHTIELSAADLNRMMRKESLNDIEAKAMADLVKRAGDCDAMIDMPDRYSWTFRKRMEKCGLTRFEAEHKADEKHPIVAAASICAKVTRDMRVAEIRASTLDFGSGYPSDEKTRSALRNKAALALLKPYIRDRWKTLDTVRQRKLFDHEKEPLQEGKD